LQFVDLCPDDAQKPCANSNPASLARNPVHKSPSSLPFGIEPA
jgi:hypothetical protein